MNFRSTFMPSYLCVCRGGSNHLPLFLHLEFTGDILVHALTVVYYLHISLAPQHLREICERAGRCQRAVPIRIKPLRL